MKARHLTSALAATAVAAVALTGCAGTTDSTDASDDELLPVSVAVLGPGALQWLHAIADAEGFYTENGVEVEAVQVQNSGALVQAVASGSADTGIALGDNVIKAVDEGAPITITGALIQKPALRLYGAPGVEDISELEGTQVTAGATEGGTYDLLVYMLEQAGVDTSSLTPVAIANSSDRVVAMQNEQVSGALLIPPFDTLAVDSGATELGWYDDYWLETPAIVNTDWASENPEAASGFTKGLAEAAEFFADDANEAEVVQVLLDYSSVSEDAAQNAYDFIHDNEVFSTDLTFPDSALSNVAEISASVAGEDASDFDPSAYYDMSYLED